MASSSSPPLWVNKPSQSHGALRVLKKLINSSEPHRMKHVAPAAVKPQLPQANKVMMEFLELCFDIMLPACGRK